jgi:hypothetical protein
MLDYIEVEWRVPLVRLGYVHSLVQLENSSIVNLRWGGAIWGKRWTLGWEGWGE